MTDPNAKDFVEKDINESFQIQIKAEKMEHPDYRAGVAEERNKRYRKTMEVFYYNSKDSHLICYNVCGDSGTGLFAVFDGHAGKQASEYCAGNFLKVFERLVKENPSEPIPVILKKAFLNIDNEFFKANVRSGCTAVVGYVRYEKRAFLESVKKRVICINKRVLYTANVGDSRAVLSYFSINKADRGKL